AAGDLVLAERFPGPPDRQPADAERDDVGDEREAEDQVVEEDDALDGRVLEPEEIGKAALAAVLEFKQAEEGRPRYVEEAVRPASQALPVAQDDADDLAEGEGHDGKVVAAQPENREAEDHPPEGGEDAGERQAKPEREAEMRGEQGVGIGADAVEGDIAEVEKAGEADHDVEAPAEHDVGEDQNPDLDHVAAVVGVEIDHEDRQGDAERQEKGAADIAGERDGAGHARRARAGDALGLSRPPDEEVQEQAAGEHDPDEDRDLAPPV